MAKENIWQILDDTVLKENIQKRPGMFLGATGQAGMESLIVQTLDNLLELAKEMSHAELAIELSDKQLIFSYYTEQGFLLNKEQRGSYSPYLFLAMVNALSEQMGFGVETNGKRVIQIYQDGLLKQKVLIPSDVKDQRIELAFTPDKKIFGDEKLSYFVLFNRCQELAMLNSGLKISLTDGGRQKNTFQYKQGLVEYIFQKDDSITRSGQPLVINTLREEIKIQAVISKNSSASIQDGFVNGHLPSDGGTHLDGFIHGAVDAINQFLEKTNRLKYLTTANFPERFDLVLSIEVKRPRYVGAVKKKIRNPELYKIVREAAFEEISLFLKRHPAWYLS